MSQTTRGRAIEAAALAIADGPHPSEDSYNRATAAFDAIVETLMEPGEQALRAGNEAGDWHDAYDCGDGVADQVWLAMLSAVKGE